jgi:hypothetical protein
MEAAIIEKEALRLPESERAVLAGEYVMEGRQQASHIHGRIGPR